MERQKRDCDSDLNQSSDYANNGTTTVKECPICWTDITNLSLTDTCLHEFCFECLNEWSLGSVNPNRCPLCRQIYRSIICNIVSEELYDQIQVPEFIEEQGIQFDSIIYRIVLSVRLTFVKNQTQLQRNRVSEELIQLKQTLGKMSGNENELREQIQNLESEVQRLDSDINELNAILSSDNPSIDVLLNALNQREEVLNILNEDIVNESDNESNDSMPSLVSNSSHNFDNESDEENDESERQNRRRNRKRRQRNSDDFQESGKRSRNQ